MNASAWGGNSGSVTDARLKRMVGRAPNGSRLSCGRNARWRKVVGTAETKTSRRGNAILPTRAPDSFKRLLGCSAEVLRFLGVDAIAGIVHFEQMVCLFPSVACILSAPQPGAHLGKGVADEGILRDAPLGCGHGV